MRPTCLPVDRLCFPSLCHDHHQSVASTCQHQHQQRERRLHLPRSHHQSQSQWQRWDERSLARCRRTAPSVERAARCPCTADIDRACRDKHLHTQTRVLINASTCLRIGVSTSVKMGRTRWNSAGQVMICNVYYFVFGTRLKFSGRYRINLKIMGEGQTSRKVLNNPNYREPVRAIRPHNLLKYYLKTIN